MTIGFISVGLQLAAAVWSLALLVRRRNWRITSLSILVGLSAWSTLLSLPRQRLEPARWQAEIPQLLAGATFLAALWLLRRVPALPASPRRGVSDQDEMLGVLFEQAPDGCYLNDLSGVFVDGNRAAEELIGYRKEELINRKELRSVEPAFRRPTAAGG